MDQMKTTNSPECDIVQDLLPLYHDSVCSVKSRKLIEEHLKTCENCRKMLVALDESEAEKDFAASNQDVLRHHVRKEKSAAFKTGVIIAGILMVPVMIALIMTLAGYSNLKADAVLIASMLLTAGMTVVPLMAKRKKLTKTITFSVSALLLLTFFGEMFFDNGGILRFGEIAFSLIFGLSVMFFPFIVIQADLPDTVSNHKGLLIISWDTIWFYLMIFVFSIDYSNYREILLGTSTFFMAFVWLIFLTIRYLKVNAWIKSGIAILLFGICVSYANYVGWIIIYDRDFHKEILVSGLVVGVAFVLTGSIMGFMKRRR